MAEFMNDEFPDIAIHSGIQDPDVLKQIYAGTFSANGKAYMDSINKKYHHEKGS